MSQSRHLLYISVNKFHTIDNTLTAFSKKQSVCWNIVLTHWHHVKILIWLQSVRWSLMMGVSFAEALVFSTIFGWKSFMWSKTRMAHACSICSYDYEPEYKNWRLEWKRSSACVKRRLSLPTGVGVLAIVIQCWLGSVCAACTPTVHILPATG